MVIDAINVRHNATKNSYLIDGCNDFQISISKIGYFYKKNSKINIFLTNLTCSLIMEIFLNYILPTILGGSGITYLALKTYLTTKISQDVKHEYDLKLKEVELKNAQDLQLYQALLKFEADKKMIEINSGIALKLEKNKHFAPKQIDMYSELWQKLIKIETSISNLWENANYSNLDNLSVEVESTKSFIKNNQIFINDRPQTILNSINEKIEDFQFGKDDLIRLREKMRKGEPIDELAIISTINRNSNTKAEFEKHLNELQKCLLSQLSGSQENNEQLPPSSNSLGQIN